MNYYTLIVLGILSRLLPHPPNLTPIAALGLFAGARGRSAGAWAVPLLSLLATDLWLGGYDPTIMLFVYLGFACSSVIGRCWLRQHRSLIRITSAAVAMSTAFFLLSNFGVWFSAMYPPTVAGLIACYLAGLPWFGMTLLGDLFYSLALIGIYDLLSESEDERAAQAS